MANQQHSDILKRGSVTPFSAQAIGQDTAWAASWHVVRSEGCHVVLYELQRVKWVSTQGNFVPDRIHIHGFYFQEQGSLAWHRVAAAQL